MKSVFDESTYAELLFRLNKIQPRSERKWGRMSASQMMHHCTHPLAVGLGREQLKRPYLPMRMLLRTFKKSMYNDTPWKRNLPTVKQFRVSGETDFSGAKEDLLKLLEEFHRAGSQKSWDPHPVFGRFTPVQWGRSQFKHLDHHLRQFGA